MIFLSQTLRLRCASLFHSDIYIFISPFTSSATSDWRRLQPSRLYGMHRAGTTPSVCVHIAAWRRISRTFQKPYGELYLRSRRMDSWNFGGGVALRPRRRD